MPNSAELARLWRVGVGVDDADEFRTFDFALDADVVAAEIADADDGYADLADGFRGVLDFLFRL